MAVVGDEGEDEVEEGKEAEHLVEVAGQRDVGGEPLREGGEYH